MYRHTRIFFPQKRMIIAVLIAPEKIQLSNEQIANLSDAQFETLVIRMLTELVEFGQKFDEKNEGYAK